MTFLAFLPKPTQVVTISSATNNVNLRTQVGSPAYQAVIEQIEARIKQLVIYN